MLLVKKRLFVVVVMANMVKNWGTTTASGKSIWMTNILKNVKTMIGIA